MGVKPVPSDAMSRADGSHGVLDQGPGPLAQAVSVGPLPLNPPPYSDRSVAGKCGARLRQRQRRVLIPAWGNAPGSNSQTRQGLKARANMNKCSCLIATWRLCCLCVQTAPLADLQTKRSAPFAPPPPIQGGAIFRLHHQAFWRRNTANEHTY